MVKDGLLLILNEITGQSQYCEYTAQAIRPQQAPHREMSLWPRMTSYVLGAGGSGMPIARSISLNVFSFTPGTSTQSRVVS